MGLSQLDWIGHLLHQLLKEGLQRLWYRLIVHIKHAAVGLMQKLVCAVILGCRCQEGLWVTWRAGILDCYRKSCLSGSRFSITFFTRSGNILRSQSSTVSRRDSSAAMFVRIPHVLQTLQVFHLWPVTQNVQHLLCELHNRLSSYSVALELRKMQTVSHGCESRLTCTGRQMTHALLTSSACVLTVD